MSDEREFQGQEEFQAAKRLVPRNHAAIITSARLLFYQSN